MKSTNQQNSQAGLNGVNTGTPANGNGDCAIDNGRVTRAAIRDMRESRWA